jgi:hypothetical protein
LTFLIISDGIGPCEGVDDGRGVEDPWGAAMYTDAVPGDSTLAGAGVDTAMGAGVEVIAVLLNSRLELMVLVKISIVGGDGGGDGGSGVIDPKLHCGVNSVESPFSSSPGS